jgi:D-psicose/D-tagatose/L-ribulose 3-epimerase
MNRVEALSIESAGGRCGMGFRVALCNEVLRELEFPRQCVLAAALGYAGIELAPFTLSDTPHQLGAATVAALRGAAADAGVRIAGLHWLLIKPDGLSLTSDDAAVRARSIEVMRRLIALCAELGGDYLVHGSPAQRRLPDNNEAARGWVEEAFIQAGRAAEQVGVTYCIEPLAPGLTNCFNTVAEAAELVQRVRLPALRTMLDFSAAMGGERESPAELLRRWLPTGMIAHVHLNDANHRGPGQGAGRFAAMLLALRDGNYRGWIGIEPFDYVPDGPTCAARAIGYVRGIEETL